MLAGCAAARRVRRAGWGRNPEPQLSKLMELASFDHQNLILTRAERLAAANTQCAFFDCKQSFDFQAKKKQLHLAFCMLHTQPRALARCAKPRASSGAQQSVNFLMFRRAWTIARLGAVCGPPNLDIGRHQQLPAAVAAAGCRPGRPAPDTQRAAID